MSAGTDPTIEELVRKLVREEVRVCVAQIPTSIATAEYVSVAQYAKTRAISVSTVRNAIRDGRLPAMKIGAALRVRADVEIGASVIPVVRSPGPSPAKRAEQIMERTTRTRLACVR